MTFQLLSLLLLNLSRAHEGDTMALLTSQLRSACLIGVNKHTSSQSILAFTPGHHRVTMATAL